MGFDNENIGRRIILDLETAPIDGVESYLEPVDAPSNYKDPLKIAAYQAEALAGQAAKAALDPDLCRIVAVGALEAPGSPRDASGDVWLCRDEAEEKTALEVIWDRYRGCHVVGYNVVGFDLPVLLRRSLYLGVKAPAIQLDKYRHPTVTDLMLILSRDGQAKFRSLSFYLKRFGLPATDGTGAEVPALVATGDWAGVEKHLRADLQATEALAIRMGCR